MSAIQQDCPLPDQLPTTVTFVDQPEEGLLTTKRITDALLELADLNGCDLEVRRVPRPKQVAAPVWVKEKCEEFERRLQETVDKMTPTEDQAKVTALRDKIWSRVRVSDTGDEDSNCWWDTVKVDAILLAALTDAYERGFNAGVERVAHECDVLVQGNRRMRAILCGPFRTPDILEAHRQGEIKEEAYLYIAKWSREQAIRAQVGQEEGKT